MKCNQKIKKEVNSYWLNNLCGGDILVTDKGLPTELIWCLRCKHIYKDAVNGVDDGTQA